MTNAPATFDAHAADYEAPRRRLIPPFDAFYGTAVDALTLLGRPPRRVLDLGAGTGMLAARVAAAHPEAELVLTDGAPAMLAQARAALGERATCVVADLADPLPGGGFVNAEQVAGPTPCFERLYRTWHEASARAAGTDGAEWAGALERMRHDRCADVESQLRWLREAGFDAADCLFKDHRFAVLVARRAGG